MAGQAHETLYDKSYAYPATEYTWHNNYCPQSRHWRGRPPKNIMHVKTFLFFVIPAPAPPQIVGGSPTLCGDKQRGRIHQRFSGGKAGISARGGSANALWRTCADARFPGNTGPALALPRVNMRA